MRTKFLIIVLTFIGVNISYGQIAFISVSSGISQNSSEYRDYDGKALYAPLNIRIGGGLPGLQLFAGYSSCIKKPKYYYIDDISNDERFYEEFKINQLELGLRLNTSNSGSSVGFLGSFSVSSVSCTRIIMVQDSEFESEKLKKSLGLNASIGIYIRLGDVVGLTIEDGISYYTLDKNGESIPNLNWHILTVGVSVGLND